ncbi:uncharacterized protein [Nothobranchius furzeri]|uniref:uncharacterized protein n=1 Tax=Nothobranchius furzeri TaxID=105023 RepID=UPI00077CE266
MWLKVLFFFWYVSSQVTAHQINVSCDECYEFPPTDVEACPSKVAALEVKVADKKETKLNISWAINIDASIKYLTGTWFEISGLPSHFCEYDPPFAQANLTGSEQEWFHIIVDPGYGHIGVDVSNIPLPHQRGGDHSLSKSIWIPSLQKSRDPTTSVAEDLYSTVETFTEPPPGQRIHDIVIFTTGVMAALMLLSFLYLLCKRSCSVLKFKNLSTSNSVPIPVLVVYPAENSAFQHAVVMLAEFLQLHGGCKVAIDLWQQGKVAEKGPLRWLSEQTKAAEHVLIVSPLGEASSSLLQNKQTPPEHSIPAAAHDLYPLILNMVASQAKCSSELAKFSVVHLSKKPCVCLPELKVCRSFYLMKDLNNLCKKLQKPRKAEKKIVWMLFKPGLSHNKKDSAKLKSALETLEGLKPSSSRELLIGDL